MRIKYIGLTLCFFVGFGLSTAIAQMSLDTLFLNEFEIIASKVDYTSPVKKSTIDSLFKQNLDHLDLGELLAAYTPVFIRAYGKGTLSTASFRGTGASHTQVLWNDFKINSPMAGQCDFSELPNAFFDHVDLYYGGASLLKSNGGLGGSINLENKTFNPARPIFSFNQSIGSFKTISTSANLSLGSKKFSSETRFVYQSSKNDFSYNNNAILPAQTLTLKDADYRNSGFVQEFGFKPSDAHQFTLTTWNMWNQRNIPPTMTQVEKNDGFLEYQKDFFSRNILGWSYIKNRATAEVKVAFFTQNLDYIQEINIAGEPGLTDTLINSANRNSGYFIKGNYAYSFKKGPQLKVGADVEIDRVNSNNYAGIEQRNTLSSYAMVVQDFWDRLKINLLLRTQITDGTFLPVTPLLGLNLKLLDKKDLYFRTSIARNYHLPTLNDLYWSPGGNTSLEPEDSFEYEAGINYILNVNNRFALKADITAYANWVSNWIQWIDTGNGYWEPRNINEVFARGMEFSAHLSGSSGILSYILFLEYAYTRTTNQTELLRSEEQYDEQLIYIPLNTANSTIHLGLKKYYAEWNIQFVGERKTLGEPLPAYMLNHMSIGKKFDFKHSGLNLRFKMNNIFNEDYQAVLWRPMPGRSYELIVIFNLNRTQ